MMLVQIETFRECHVGAVGGFLLVSCGCSWRLFVSVMWVQLEAFC